MNKLDLKLLLTSFLCLIAMWYVVAIDTPVNDAITGSLKKETTKTTIFIPSTCVIYVCSISESLLHDLNCETDFRSIWSNNTWQKVTKARTLFKTSCAGQNVVRVSEYLYTSAYYYIIHICTTLYQWNF